MNPTEKTKSIKSVPKAKGSNLKFYLIGFYGILLIILLGFYITDRNLTESTLPLDKFLNSSMLEKGDVSKIIIYNNKAGVFIKRNRLRNYVKYKEFLQSDEETRVKKPHYIIPLEYHDNFLRMIESRQRNLSTERKAIIEYDHSPDYIPWLRAYLGRIIILIGIFLFIFYQIISKNLTVSKLILHQKEAKEEKRIKRNLRKLRKKEAQKLKLEERLKKKQIKAHKILSKRESKKQGTNAPSNVDNIIIQESSDGISDFFKFRKMISLYIIQFIYILGILVITFFSFNLISKGQQGYSGEIAMWMGIGLFVIGNIIWRLICEFWVLLFRIASSISNIEKLALKNIFTLKQKP